MASLHRTSNLKHQIKVPWQNQGQKLKEYEFESKNSEKTKYTFRYP